ncbi:MAG TPA: calcium-binding protein, partial [Burkholderiales bacterium]
GSFTGTGNGLANVITGGAGSDTLNGGAGADTLDGGAGADRLAGGAGDDTYHVNVTGDIVAEAAGGGIDTVISTANSHTLRANVENLSFAGIGNFSGTGNGLANSITGGAGNDVLNGGAGADSMAGGAGNDIYLVDNAGDVVSELAGGGTDTVQTTLASRTLEAQVENLVFTGVGSFSGTGNDLANRLISGAGNDSLAGLGGNDTLNGGAGNDTLDGGAGVDLLAGGAGDDTYHVDSASDVVSEGAVAGTDTVVSTAGAYTLAGNVENLSFAGIGSFVGAGNGLANGLTGGGGDDTLGGAGGNDTMDGGAGNDSLNGGQGDDRVTGGGGDDFLIGGPGADVFVFAAGFGHDTVSGFDSNPAGGQDLLDLSAFGITDFANQVSITDLGSDTLITIEADSVLLLGIANPAAAIDQSDFILA